MARTNVVESLSPAVAEEWLDSKERERYARFREPQSAQRFLLGRLIVKSIAMRTVGAPRVRFGYSTNGKPYLVGHTNLFFSITHSADAVAVAIAAFPVGVDIESPARRNKPWQRPGTFLHPHAAARVEAMSHDGEQGQVFLQHWTCQEAAVKLLDASIFNRGMRVALNVGDDTGICGERLLHFSSWRPSPSEGTAEVFIVDSSRESGLVLSLAAEQPVQQVLFRQWRPELLSH